MENICISLRLIEFILTAILIFRVVITNGQDGFGEDGFGEDEAFDVTNKFIFSTGNMTSNTRYLIYDVNPGEGFNLRRDVYIRVANLVEYMNKRGENWILVLPPWRHLYHWKSRYIDQEGLKWNNFFDLRNLNYYVPVMEFEEFMKFEGYHGIDQILFLQRHPNGFQQSFKQLVETDRCTERFHYHLDENHLFRGYFWNRDMFARKHDCVSVQGHALVLADFLKGLDARSVLIERFEQVMHVQFGSIEFFKARRSLVFARYLRDEADRFRLKYLNSNDEDDHTHYEEDWREQIPLEGHARGGPFIGLHMRRGDFAHAHKEVIPTIEEIGKEVEKMLKKYKITQVYVATDGSDKEIQELQSYFKAQVHRFPRTDDILEIYKDGGIAIIDQWIVSHAKYFIGTCQSTFSYRIHEERDILGFEEGTTYNCICGKQSPKDRCEQPARWRVKFG